MRINWSTQLQTGIRAIDLQHEELIEILNELDTACTETCSRVQLDDILSRLNTYIVFHFGTEETLMSDLKEGDAHVNNHLQQHRAFVDYITTMSNTPQDEPGTLAKLLAYLQDWLVRHILQTDRTLAGLLAEAGKRN